MGKAEVNATAIARALPIGRRQKETAKVDNQKEMAKAARDRYPILMRSETIDPHLFLENSELEMELECASST